MFPNSPTALVVEDSQANLTYLLFLLKKLEINALTANNGEKALELMQSEDADLMLLDISLGPGISGITLVQELRKMERFATVPIVAVTAFYGGTLSRELLEKGFTDIIEKPYSFNQFTEVLQNYFPIQDMD